MKVLETATVAAMDVTLSPAYQQLINRYSKYRINVIDSL
jgi:hypothetical protein